jgi:UDP-glucose 4-epimerase
MRFNTQLLALDKPNGYQLYNLGNGEPVELAKFINLVELSVGKEANIKVLPPQPGDVERTCANIDKVGLARARRCAPAATSAASEQQLHGC